MLLIRMAETGRVHGGNMRAKEDKGSEDDGGDAQRCADGNEDRGLGLVLVSLWPLAGWAVETQAGGCRGIPQSR